MGIVPLGFPETICSVPPGEKWTVDEAERGLGTRKIDLAYS
jgi:hypothetical protein